MQRRVRSLVHVVLISALSGAFSCTAYVSSHLRQAEEHLRAERYEDAIREYQLHMEERLAVVDRPEWENPHFYRLLIGDIYLSRGDVPNALDAYESAESHGVHATLISDRYRSVAAWHEKRGELRAAMTILTQYRTRDPLLFDAALDRVAKALTALEDVGE